MRKQELVVLMGIVIAIVPLNVELRAVESVKDTPFVQEYHESYPIDEGGKGDRASIHCKIIPSRLSS